MSVYFRIRKKGFPGGSDGKESACIAGDPDSIPGLGRFPGEGKAYSLHGQRNLGTTVHRVAESLTQLSD